MDQIKSQGVKSQPVGKDGKPLQSIESYQAHWAQLMEDTNLKIQQIREEEQRRADQQAQSSGR
ncbi:uncharacterized protein N7503_009752 [Penicillium pulvis]|uniref:Uncharacterized protein n=1 Tax=Penicillium frequentans TaxID=3151616 RepID=A0AAD6CPW9_9EURO|nr:uncharacterized protein N7503_009752 [Penicillium pulvis]KAJ5526124.1 hypothetical protein N7494_012774 [Penicillium glabrum]KAJ5547636.1 hypothetical protein N7513_004870 [Penicillium glabrum]KAJ5784540.1 hypothetical protein N7503_009752 [Penicillium pulvis]